MKLIYCLMIFLWPFVSTGQTVTALQIGDTIPDITLTNVYNYPSSTIHLSDLKGKLVILDFMATTCVPCVKVLPSFDSLQQAFGEQVQIILISSEKPESVKAFLKKHNSLKLPLAADSDAARFFPHSYISHVAWVNPKDVVCAITHTERVNDENIRAVLKGQKVNWPVKRDIDDYDFSKPLLQINENKIPDEGRPAQCYYISVISYLPGVQKYSKITEDSLQNTTHISLINFGILDLYKILFERFQMPLSQIKIQSKNKSLLIYDPSLGYFESWKKKNVYCIEATLPRGIPIQQQKEKLINDIDFYFDLNASLEKRDVQCLIMRNKGHAVKKASVKEGLTLGSVIGTLNHRLGSVPVIDETHDMLDITLPITEEEVTDNCLLQKILDEYGIELTVEKREMEFLVIKNSGSKNQVITNSKYNYK